MKKIILTFVVLFGMSQFSIAQIDLGVGLMATDNAYGALAIEAKADFGISEKISVSPSVDYFFPTGADLLGIDDGVDLLLTVSLDGHYYFEIMDGFKAYPLAGINLLVSNVDDNNWYWDAYDFGPRIFINAGAGATYAFSDSMKAYLELKYTRFGPTASAGVLFSLGK